MTNRAGPAVEDAHEPNTIHRYKVCVENPVNRICSAEIIGGTFGLAASFESFNVRKHYMRHRNWLGALTPVSNQPDSEDSPSSCARA